MNISGIRPSADFYSYNSIKLSELRNHQIMASKKAEQNVDDVDIKDSVYSQENVPQYRQQFSSFDYAKEYKPDETYELKGVESDISLLDVEKAVSELDKDKVLQQYQFFVGNDVLENRQKDGVVSTAHTGENFSL